MLSAAYAPDGKTLALSGTSGQATVWDIGRNPWKEVRRSELSGWGYAVRYSPDGRTIASGGDDCRVRLTDLQTSQVLHTFSPFFSVKSLSFSPNGQWLAVGGGSQGYGGVKVWSVKTGKLKWAPPEELDGSQEVQSLSFSPDGTTVAGVRHASHSELSTGRCLLTFWQANTGRIKLSVSGQIEGHGLSDETYEGSARTGAVAYSPDGQTLAVNWSGVTILDASSSRTLSNIPHPEVEVCAVAFSRSGKWLATGGATTRSTPETSDYEVKIWDAKSLKLMRTLRFQRELGGPHLGQVKTLQFSPDGRTLLAGIANRSGVGQVKTWDIYDLR